MNILNLFRRKHPTEDEIRQYHQAEDQLIWSEGAQNYRHQHRLAEYAWPEDMRPHAQTSNHR